uniref:Tensin-like C1 domain-containing phosphatase n=1 Tax=Callorhinchus milii TaxID=7868 RepID=A0A4W3H2I5_CALMI
MGRCVNANCCRCCRGISTVPKATHVTSRSFLSDVLYTRGPLDGSLYAKVKKRSPSNVTANGSPPSGNGVHSGHALSVSTDSGHSTASAKTEEPGVNPKPPPSRLEREQLDRLLTGFGVGPGKGPGQNRAHPQPHAHARPVPNERETDILDDEEICQMDRFATLPRNVHHLGHFCGHKGGRQSPRYGHSPEGQRSDVYYRPDVTLERRRFAYEGGVSHVNDLGQESRSHDPYDHVKSADSPHYQPPGPDRTNYQRQRSEVLHGYPAGFVCAERMPQGLIQRARHRDEVHRDHEAKAGRYRLMDYHPGQGFLDGHHLQFLEQSFPPEMASHLCPCQACASQLPREEMERALGGLKLDHEPLPMYQHPVSPGSEIWQMKPHLVANPARSSQPPQALPLLIPPHSYCHYPRGQGYPPLAYGPLHREMPTPAQMPHVYASQLRPSSPGQFQPRMDESPEPLVPYLRYPELDYQPHGYHPYSYYQQPLCANRNCDRCPGTSFTSPSDLSPTPRGSQSPLSGSTSPVGLGQSQILSRALSERTVRREEEAPDSQQSPAAHHCADSSPWGDDPSTLPAPGQPQGTESLRRYHREAGVTCNSLPRPAEPLPPIHTSSPVYPRVLVAESGCGAQTPEPSWTSPAEGNIQLPARPRLQSGEVPGRCPAIEGPTDASPGGRELNGRQEGAGQAGAGLVLGAQCGLNHGNRVNFSAGSPGRCSPGFGERPMEAFSETLARHRSGSASISPCPVASGSQHPSPDVSASQGSPDSQTPPTPAFPVSSPHYASRDEAFGLPATAAAAGKAQDVGQSHPAQREVFFPDAEGRGQPTSCHLLPQHLGHRWALVNR